VSSYSHKLFLSDFLCVFSFWSLLARCTLYVPISLVHAFFINVSEIHFTRRICRPVVKRNNNSLCKRLKTINF
jgi:hypothetical protein